MAKKKNTLVAVLGGCAQLMWLSSGCQNVSSSCKAEAWVGLVTSGPISSMKSLM